jgi:threonine dehydrogenase-like Zn-dependent dehydrogenase
VTFLRAAMFYEPGDVRMEDAPEPGPGEVLVRVGAALTCGTDVKTYNRGHPTLFKELPSPFGHEFGGTIEAVGEGVEDWSGIFRHIPYTLQVAFDLLKRGRVDPEPFISGVRPLEEVTEALESHGRQEGIKYEIRPSEGESS